MTGKERILARFEGRPVDRLPLMAITMMFASDTIGAPYKAYVTDYRVLAEAQMKTAETYRFDYVSAISDPAREAGDLGAAVEWFDNQPPAIVESQALLADKSTLGRLEIPDPPNSPRMRDRLEAVRLLRREAGDRLLVEGWVEGPCAMAADLRGVNTLMLDFHDDEAFVRDLFEFAVQMEIRFAHEQVKAGADLIGIGDAAASLIGPRLYSRYVLPYEQKLVAGIHATGARVRLHICGNTRRILEGMGRVGADMVDLDFPAPVDEARRQMGPRQVLLGNMDPVRALRDGTPASVQAKLADCHRAAGELFIAGAGCEIPRGTPPENVLAMADYCDAHPLPPL